MLRAVNKTISLLLALSAGCASLAAGTGDFCARPLRIALFEFGVLYQASKDDGIDVRLLDAIHKRTGCTFERVVLPRNRIWAELQNGTLDLATGAVPSPERKAYAFLLPYLTTRNVVLLKKSSGAKIATMADFEASDLRLGVVRGFKNGASYDDMVKRLTPKGRIVEAVDIPDVLRFLERDIADALIGQTLAYPQYLSEGYVSNTLIVRDWAPKSESITGALVLSRKSFSTAQARNWDELLVSMQKDGSLLKISRQFLPPSQARDLIYTGPRSPD